MLDILVLVRLILGLAFSLLLDLLRLVTSPFVFVYRVLTMDLIPPRYSEAERDILDKATEIMKTEKRAIVQLSRGQPLTGARPDPALVKTAKCILNARTKYRLAGGRSLEAPFSAALIAALRLAQLDDQPRMVLHFGLDRLTQTPSTPCP